MAHTRAVRNQSNRPSASAAAQAAAHRPTQVPRGGGIGASGQATARSALPANGPGATKSPRGEDLRPAARLTISGGRLYPSGRCPQGGVPLAARSVDRGPRRATAMHRSGAFAPPGPPWASLLASGCRVRARARACAGRPERPPSPLRRRGPAGRPSSPRDRACQRDRRGDLNGETRADTARHGQARCAVSGVRRLRAQPTDPCARSKRPDPTPSSRPRSCRTPTARCPARGRCRSRRAPCRRS